uniref:Uncharacterized protein n=1 Tax=Anguilla anguilla TaxID=7936 RepID=A0A0E9PZZ0_ANGAN
MLIISSYHLKHFTNQMTFNKKDSHHENMLCAHLKFNLNKNNAVF